MAVQSPVPPVTAAAAAAADSGSDDEMDDEVEGPQWDASKVQYGLPMGVRNTYSIDNMEQMSPDEYQAALRQGRAGVVWCGVSAVKMARERLYLRCCTHKTCVVLV